MSEGSKRTPSHVAQKSRRQIVFDWLMQDEGYWGGSEEVARVDDLLTKLDAAAPSSTVPTIPFDTKEVEWLRKFINFSVFGPPPADVSRAQNIITDILSALDTSRACTAERQRRVKELESERSATVPTKQGGCMYPSGCDDEQKCNDLGRCHYKSSFIRKGGCA
jgi:hypothetical protein